MGLDSYDGLKEAVNLYLLQEDLSDSFTGGDTILETLIALAEEHFSEELRLRYQWYEDTGNNLPSNGILPLPDDLIEIASFGVQYDGAWRRLDQRPPQEFYVSRQQQAPGSPSIYTIAGETLEVAPAPDSDEMPYQLYGYTEFPKLSTTTQTNRLLQKHPALYLYGTLKEAGGYLIDDTTRQRWNQEYERARRGAISRDVRARTRPNRRSLPVLLTNLGRAEGRRNYP